MAVFSTVVDGCLILPVLPNATSALCNASESDCSTVTHHNMERFPSFLAEYGGLTALGYIQVSDHHDWMPAAWNVQVSKFKSSVIGQVDHASDMRMLNRPK